MQITNIYTYNKTTLIYIKHTIPIYIHRTIIHINTYSYTQHSRRAFKKPYAYNNTRD